MLVIKYVIYQPWSVCVGKNYAQDLGTQDRGKQNENEKEIALKCNAYCNILLSCYCFVSCKSNPEKNGVNKGVKWQSETQRN